MKKLINIFLCISILCGCGGMTGLRRQSSKNIHKKINEEGGLYYYDKKGHNDEVKMSIINKDYYKIKIPVTYTVNAKNLNKINTIPSLEYENTDNLSNQIGKCNNCSINEEYLTIDMVYKMEHGGDGKDIGLCIASIIFAPIGLIITIANKEASFKDLINVYRENCAGKGSLQIPETINISEPEDMLELKEMGVIDYTFDVTPKQIKVSCNKKSCAVLDQNENFVNKVIINKKITINERKIKEIAAAEKLAEQKRKIEEEKRKKEEAKRQAEYEREQRRQQKLRAKECPGLYRTLYWTQQGGYIDPIMGVKVARRFEELDCGTWLNEQLNGY